MATNDGMPATPGEPQRLAEHVKEAWAWLMWADKRPHEFGDRDKALYLRAALADMRELIRKAEDA